jgi:hypothetical protein
VIYPGDVKRVTIRTLGIRQDEENVFVGSHTLDISKRAVYFEGETGGGFRRNKEFHNRVYPFQL